MNLLAEDRMRSERGQAVELVKHADAAASERGECCAGNAEFWKRPKPK